MLCMNNREGLGNIKFFWHVVNVVRQTSYYDLFIFLMSKLIGKVLASNDKKVLHSFISYVNYH